MRWLSLVVFLVSLSALTFQASANSNSALKDSEIIKIFMMTAGQASFSASSTCGFDGTPLDEFSRSLTHIKGDAFCGNIEDGGAPCKAGEQATGASIYASCSAKSDSEYKCSIQVDAGEVDYYKFNLIKSSAGYRIKGGVVVFECAN